MHGYQHTAVNLAALVPAAGILYLVGRPDPAAALAAGVVFGTLFVTPDLDLALNDARRRWGPLRFIWAPYAALSRHRGISHTYLAGPVIRLAYLCAWLLPLLVLTRAMHVALPAPDSRLSAIALLGYFAAQWLHLLCDDILPFDSGQRGAARRRR